MILLPTGHRVLYETINDFLKPSTDLLDDGEAKPTRAPVDVKLCDFDDVTYRIVIDQSNLDVIQISMNMPCYAAIKDQGAEKALDQAFPNARQPAIPGYDVTLHFSIEQSSTQSFESELAKRVSSLKSLALGGVYQRYFQGILTSQSINQSFDFQLRDDTHVYLVPKSDRLTVVYTISFADKTDSAIARIFMQEFVEAKRRIGQAPPCTFSSHPPLELKEFHLSDEVIRSSLGFLSFAVLKNHLEGDRAVKVTDLLASFRTYLHYHITCSKSYFHARMRARVDSLLKILSRAKLEQQGQEKKTISGKTFVRS